MWEHMRNVRVMTESAFNPLPYTRYRRRWVLACVLNRGLSGLGSVRMERIDGRTDTEGSVSIHYTSGEWDDVSLSVCQAHLVPRMSENILPFESMLARGAEATAWPL
jgi:hypothetical protein